MNPASQQCLLVATIGVPFVLLVACALAPIRRAIPVLAVFAPLPALAAALLAPVTPILVLGPPRLRLALALDLPGAILLGVSAILWIAAGWQALMTMRDSGSSGRFIACWLAAMTGCLGAFVVADVVSLYAMLGVMTVGATGLVVHDETPRAWRAGGIYFGLALAGESVLLAGLVMASASAGGSLLISDAAVALVSSPQRDLMLWLIVGGLGLKAGIVPMHVWMPLAYPAAPVPASSVMSGAMVKVSIIGLIRFLPLDTSLPEWGQAITMLGFLGAFYGVAVGLTQRDPRAVLAYSSVSQIGVIVAVLGIGLAAGDSSAAGNAAFYASHHVLVKGALFLAIGVIISGAGRRWQVLWPAVLLCLGLGGLPLTGGAVAKYAVKDQLDVGAVGWLAAASAVGTTWLMLHFVRRLAVLAEDGGAPAPARVSAVPWLVMAVAALVVPWLLYPTLAGGAASVTLAPAALWAAAWPVVLGSVLAFLAQGAMTRWREIAAGDVVFVLDAAGRAVARTGRTLVNLDFAIRQWAVAALLLLGLVLGLGWTIAGR
jgi:formate hydrogenlyase subunit 3/multisubunit Na+/H+ antiporter MnhD subunit